MAESVINQITQKVTRGANVGTTDALNFTALSIIRIGITPSTEDYLINVDYILTDGKPDWSPAGKEPLPGSIYYITFTYQPASSFKDFQTMSIEMETDILALQPLANTAFGSVIKDIFINAPTRQLVDVFGELSRLSAIQSILNVDQFTNQELDEYGANFNLLRLTETNASGQAIFSASAISVEPILIPASTRISTLTTSAQGNMFFRTTQDGIILPGFLSVAIPIEAELPGLYGNVGPNSITVVNTPILGVAGVTNPTPTTGGRDSESNTDYADRIRDSFLPTDKGTVRGITRLVKDNANVIDALVVGTGDPLLVRGDGTGQKVDVYVQSESGFSTVIENEAYSYYGTDIELVHQPVLSISSVSAGPLGSEVPVSNFVLLKDGSELSDSSRAQDLLSFIGGPPPVAGNSILVTYAYNSLLEGIQDTLDSDENHIPSRDLLVRSAVQVFIDVTARIRINKTLAFNFSQVQNQVITNITSIIENGKLGSEIKYGDIFNAIHDTSGVSDVQPLSLLAKRGQIAAETIQLTAKEFPRAGSIIVTEF